MLNDYWTLTNNQAYANIISMTNPNQQTPEQPSTPQQAADIFTQLGDLTALQGKQYGDTHSYSDDHVDVPDRVAAHFPETEEDSSSVGTNLYVSQKFDRATGHPRTGGVVGMVTFNQIERRDAGLIYAAHVNYHVISDDGETFRLERHVTNTEHGPHKVAESLGRTASREDMQRNLDEMVALKARVEGTREVEAGLGLLTVTSQEADQIKQVVTALNTLE